MLERIIMCLFALGIAVLAYFYIDLHGEYERMKDRLSIEQRAKMMYKQHADKLYERLMNEQKETQRAQRDADMYRTVAMVFEAQKKSAPMAVGDTQSANKSMDSIAESGEFVNG